MERVLENSRHRLCILFLFVEVSLIYSKPNDLSFLYGLFILSIGLFIQSIAILSQLKGHEFYFKRFIGQPPLLTQIILVVGFGILCRNSLVLASGLLGCVVWFHTAKRLSSPNTKVFYSVFPQLVFSKNEAQSEVGFVDTWRSKLIGVLFWPALLLFVYFFRLNNVLGLNSDFLLLFLLVITVAVGGGLVLSMEQPSLKRFKEKE